MVLKNVQALRCFAALLVVLFHIGDERGFERRYISPEIDFTQIFAWFGSFGVDLFFVISGFIMVATTWNEFAQPNASRRFFTRRLIRVYPAYWLVLIPVAIVYAVRPDFVDSHGTKPDIVASFLLLPQSGEPLLLVSWSLVFEMMFYGVFAVALFLPRRNLPIVIVIWLMIIFAASRASTYLASPYLSLIGSWLPVEFMLGMVVGALTMSGQLWAPITMATAGTIMLVASFAATAPTFHVSFSVREQILTIALPFAILLYGAVGLERRRQWQAPRAFVALGDSSYAIYLWHVPVLSALGRAIATLHLRGPLAHACLDVFFVAAACAVGIVFYRYLECPITRTLKKQFDDGDDPVRGLEAGDAVSTAVRPIPPDSLVPIQPTSRFK